jgi:hypothetical protein
MHSSTGALDHIRAPVSLCARAGLVARSLVGRRCRRRAPPNAAAEEKSLAFFLAHPPMRTLRMDAMTMLSFEWLAGLT